MRANKKATSISMTLIYSMSIPIDGVETKYPELLPHRGTLILPFWPDQGLLFLEARARKLFSGIYTPSILRL
jgi:hypothetical protein